MQLSWAIRTPHEMMKDLVVVNVVSTSLFNSESTLYMYTCMKHEVAHALTEVVSVLADWGVSIGDTSDAVAPVGVTWNCPMGLARHAPHTRTDFCPQHWLLCHTGLY